MANHIIEQAMEAAKKKKRCLDYMFYGDSLKGIPCKPVPQFPGITTLFELFAVLECCWSKETAYPSCQAEWVSNDPSYGQCAVTSILVHDMFGGTIHKTTVRGGWIHYFNMIDERIVDLTREQFDLYNLPVNYETSQEVSRVSCVENKDTNQRYKQLQRNIIRFLNPEKNTSNGQTSFNLGQALFVKINDKWEKGSFLRYQNENGKDYIYIEYLSKEHRFVFPSDFVSIADPIKKEALQEKITNIENAIASKEADIRELYDGKKILQDHIDQRLYELRKGNIWSLGRIQELTQNGDNALRNYDISIHEKYIELERQKRQLQEAKKELKQL